MRAVITQSFERIHRSNLVGMGVLPLTFEEGTSWQSLGLKGDEQVEYDGEPRWVECGAVADAAPGDYLVVYAGQALEKMEREEALAMIEFYEQMESLLEAASG